MVDRTDHCLFHDNRRLSVVAIDHPLWTGQATRTVPIVFTSSADPVGAGLVASLGRPSGNAIDFSSFEYSI